MRRFEFVGGTSDKFWEVDRDDAAVSVRFGRAGTNGQTQTKDLGTAAKAIAHVDKLVAEKVKKGYVELDAAGSPPLAPAASAVPVATAPSSPPPPSALPHDGPPPDGAPASAPPSVGAEPEAPSQGDGAVELPDEDTFVFPSGWRRGLHPRRGGQVVPIKVAADTSAVVADLVAAAMTNVEENLAHADTDPTIAEAANGYLRTWRPEVVDGPVVTPLGAAVVAALVHYALPWGAKDSVEAFVDLWVEDHGAVFAAMAAIELGGLFIGDDGRGLHRRSTVPIRSSTALARQQVHCEVLAEPVIVRMRRHLAAADESTYRSVVDALASLGGDDGAGAVSENRQIVRAYLVPTETPWVDALVPFAALPHHANSRLVCAAARSIDGLPIALPWPVVRSTGDLATMVEGVGPGVSERAAEWFDRTTEADDRRRLLGVIAALPTDAAFQVLLDRLDQKHVQPIVIEVMRTYPVRALRLLPKAAAGTSARSGFAAELLRAHVIANAGIVAAVRDDLDDAVREQIDAIESGHIAVPEALVDALPRVLVTPPWTQARKVAKPIVLVGLVAPDSTAVVWEQGEQERWSRGTGWSPFGQTKDWAAAATRFTNNGENWEPSFLAQAPEGLGRPLVADWRPKNLWIADGWLKPIVAKYEADALPMALWAAQASPATQGDLLLPFEHPDVAAVITDFLTRLKSTRDVARAWFRRHPAAAARALVPVALSKPGKPRRAAEVALRTVDAAGHRDLILAAATAHGDEAVLGITTLLDTDPLDVLPAKVPGVPTWVEPELLPQILLRDRTSALPRTAVEHVLVMLAMSSPSDVYGGIDVVKEITDPTSLAQFGWALFLRWQALGFVSKEGWVLDALGWIGDDETVRRLAPMIRTWPGEAAHKRAVTGLEVLAAIGTDVALMHLHGIAQRVKFKGLKEHARAKMDEVAAQLGLTAEELADRLVPDLGLDADGSLTLDYGPRQFRVGFDEQLKPTVADEQGKRLKNLPKPGAKDDPELGAAAYKQFSALKKDVRTLATDQIRRLEQAMVTQRRWSLDDFTQLLVEHPLVGHIVRRLVWGAYVDDGTLTTSFRVAEDRTFADEHDDEVANDDGAAIGVAHPLELGDAVRAWSDVFADYEILQPFPQLGRDTYVLTDDERAATGLARFVGEVVPAGKVVGLERFGWQRGAAQDAGVQPWVYRPWGERSIVVDLDPGIYVGAISETPEQTLAAIRISPHPDGDWTQRSDLPFGDLDAVTASELIRDLTTLTASA